MAILAIPQNTPEAASNLMDLTDEIWFHAGDTSTDVRYACEMNGKKNNWFKTSKECLHTRAVFDCLIYITKLEYHNIILA